MADQMDSQSPEKITPEPKRFCAFTSSSDSDLLINKLTSSLVSPETPSSSSPITSSGKSQQDPPPIQFTITEGSSVDLTEIIKQTITSPSFVEVITPVITPVLTAVIKASVDSALSNYVSSLETKVNSQGKIIEDLLVSNAQLKETNRVLDSRIEALHMDFEGLEQYGRRNSLRFHSVPLTKDELQSTDEKIVDLCQSILDVQISVNDIDRSHIIGSINNQGKAQLICRFRNWKIKQSIYSKKKLLKDNPNKTVITEDLTQYRQHLMKKLNDARKRREVDSFWTMDGRIFAKKTSTSNRKLVNGLEDIHDLIVGDNDDR